MPWAFAALRPLGWRVRRRDRGPGLAAQGATSAFARGPSPRGARERLPRCERSRLPHLEPPPLQHGHGVMGNTHPAPRTPDREAGTGAHGDTDTGPDTPRHMRVAAVTRRARPGMHTHVCTHTGTRVRSAPEPRPARRETLGAAFRLRVRSRTCQHGKRGREQNVKCVLRGAAGPLAGGRPWGAAPSSMS